MSYSEPARPAGRGTRPSVLAALVLVTATLLGVLAYQSLTASFLSATSPITAKPLAHRPPDSPRRDHGGPLGEADGVLPAGVTVFDDTYPAVANLDPGLLDAVRQAARDAEGYGVEFYINSGWRSPEYQDQLLREAIAKYGSEEEAARWVATAATSPHVTGDAVDLGHADATAWLSENGARYGLCQTYGNEPWHYELSTDAVDSGCPQMYADPTQDPRMHR